MLASICTLGFIGAVVGQTDPALPALPEQYEVWVSANIVNRNYSVLVHEVYDRPGNRILISQYHPGTNPMDPDVGYASDLYLNEYNELLHRNESGCYGYNLDTLPRARNFMGITPGNIPSSKDFLRFNTDGFPEVYQGKKRVNGVLCDHWISDMSNATANSTMILDWYFTAPEWNMAINTTLTSLPHMLNLTGSRPEFNPITRMPTGNLHYYQHAYEFHGWHIGSPQIHHGVDVFTIPNDIECVGDVTNVPRPAERDDDDDDDDGKGVSTGAVIGIAIGSVVLGAIIGIAITKSMSSTSASSSAPTFNNPVATAMEAPSTNNDYYEDDGSTA